MKTQGPRMNEERTREVLGKLGIPVEKSTSRSIEIRRTTSVHVPVETERWRLYTSGGIVGNADQVWLSPVIRVHGHATRGPYWNKTQLEKALRAWRRGK